VHQLDFKKKLSGFQLVKKFPAFYVNRRFITPFTSARHLSLSRARSIQSMPPHPISWRSILLYRILRPFSIAQVVPAPSQMFMFREYASVYVEELSSPRSTPQAGGPPLVGCPRLLIQYIRSYTAYWRPFLRPQREDAPCRGDRHPLIMDSLIHTQNIFICHSFWSHQHVFDVWSFVLILHNVLKPPVNSPPSVKNILAEGCTKTRRKFARETKFRPLVARHFWALSLVTDSCHHSDT
jgi:hypothetical protein